MLEKWLGPESNRRHEDFQSSALPTELPSRAREGQALFLGALGNASRFPRPAEHSRTLQNRIDLPSAISENGVFPMKRFLLSWLLMITAAAIGADSPAGSFPGAAGLQLYSLRELFKKDVPGTLDLVKSLGFSEVETASTHGLPPEQYRAMLAERGLKPVSGHFQYEPLTKDVAAAVREAKALGLSFAVCPWIAHEIGNFNEEACRRAAADFNRWGEEFAKAGIKFAYHPHGYEFAPHGEGTLFDLLAHETKAEFVSFEMDVFWVVHPGKDPVKLLQKYPGRWALMHLKDIRKDARTGIYTGKAPLTDSVPIGAGMVDWPAVLREAGRAGVKHYFIEDEAPTAAEQIPQSLKYLAGLK